MLETPYPSLIYESAADVESREIADLCDYWQTKRAGRAMPHPDDIDFADIPHLAHSIVAAEYSDGPFRIRYRMVGSTQAHYSGLDFTGRYLDELGWSEYETLAGMHEEMRRSRAPVFGRYEWGFRALLPGFCEVGLFPVSRDGIAVTGGISFDDYSFFEQQLDRAR